jgi:hypothetical protein
MKGIIASAFADLAKIGESGAFVLPQKTSSTAQIKCKSAKIKNRRSAVVLWDRMRKRKAVSKN